jgi:predicted O-methyltransferase YrrM
VLPFTNLLKATKYNNLGIRKDTFLRFFELIEQRAARTCVETGTTSILDWPHGGCGTLLFGEYCTAYEGRLWTVDINPDAIKSSKWLSREFGNCIEYVSKDSIEFLSHFGPNIDALYLDSYDYDGDEANREASRDHHLKEIVAAHDKLHALSVVMIDDCKPPDGTLGKGTLVIPWLQDRGWKIDRSEYQVILVKS